MKLNIVFLGCTQAYGHAFSAANTKVEFMVKGLIRQGDICAIHNGIIGYNGISNTERKDVPNIGRVITYPKRGSQIISWISNIPDTIKDLKSILRKDCKNLIVLEMPDFHIFLIYVSLARVLNYKIAVISHEWGPTVKTVHFLRKPSVWLFTKYFGRLVDGILPISEYIIERIRHFNKPFLKVPVLADFESKEFHVKTTNSFKTDTTLETSLQVDAENAKDKYFLYCVYAAYTRVIFKIIDAFSEFKRIGGIYGLSLVLAGSKEQIGIVESYIEKVGMSKDIQIFSKIPYTQLLVLYAHASGLIIPLDPDSSQDSARFSQKIAEYLSSGSPIITNNVGEIKYYFEDKKNCILCDYRIDGFCKAFMWIAANPEASEQIGINGYELGRTEFNYLDFGKKIHDFFQNL